MPATRKSSRNAAAAKSSTGRQSTLSFNNRVSKAGAAKPTAKDAAAGAATAAAVSPSLTPPPSTKRKAVDVVEVAQNDEDDDGEQEEQEEQEGQEVKAVVATEREPKPQAEVRARKVTDAQVKKYWREVEGARIAKRVHQEELSLGEKVLRYFDISSQYGVSQASHLNYLAAPRPTGPPSPRECKLGRIGLLTRRDVALHRHLAHQAVVSRRQAGSEPPN